eukprot:768514-Pleurochrysis_carterae.AAC.1
MSRVPRGCTALVLSEAIALHHARCAHLLHITSRVALPLSCGLVCARTVRLGPSGTLDGARTPSGRNES